MSGWVIAMMLGVSTILGALGLWALLWGLRSGQFDDPKKFLDGAQLDSEEALQDAVEMEKKKEKLLKKRLKEKKKADDAYRPPD